MSIRPTSTEAGAKPSAKPVKPDNPAPGEDVFTEEDLLPDARLRSRLAIDTAAAIVAVLALGMIAGGMIALGAAAAPVVFKLPDPLSGTTMGAAFSRFDSIAMGCALVALVAEAVRTVVTLKAPQAEGWRRWIARGRRYLGILLAFGTVYVGLQLSPQIMGAYQAGVRRNVGAEGAQLEATHKRAELVGKIEVGLAAALIALHILAMADPSRVNMLDWSESE